MPLYKAEAGNMTFQVDAMSPYHANEALLEFTTNPRNLGADADTSHVVISRFEAQQAFVATSASVVLRDVVVEQPLPGKIYQPDALDRLAS